MNSVGNPFAPGEGTPPAGQERHGDTAFTVPMFAAFMQRIMPGNTWR